ncbi:MAG: T9SS type A sorting domain-containing protein [Bacteroidia bacterium]
MWRLIAFIGLVLISVSWRPHPIRMETLASYFPWEPVGPANVGNILTRGLRVGNKIYVGSAFGGLYESTDEGRTWRLTPGFSLNQNGEATYRSLAVTALAASNNVLYVGTGNITQFNEAGVSFRSLDTLRTNILGGLGLPGMGVFISTDGGQTFSNQNATWNLSYPNLSYSPNYSAGRLTNVVDMAISGDKIAIITPDSVIFSADMLQTIRKSSIPGGGPLRSVAWGGEGKLFVTNNTGLFVSNNDGQTFTAVSVSLPPEVTQGGSSGIIGIGGGNVVVRSAPSNPSILYLASANTNGELLTVWVSSDNGATWNPIASRQNLSFNVLGNLGTKTIALAIDPNDPAHILLGGNQVWEFAPDYGWRRINPPNAAPVVAGATNLVLNIPNPIRDFVFLENGDYLVIGNGRVIRITKDGSRAENASTGIQAAAVLSVAVAPNGDIHASGLTPLNIVSHYPGDPEGIFRIINYPPGQAFSPVANPVGNVAVSMRLPDNAFFSYQGGRLRMSTDRGRQYSPIYNAPAPYAFYNDDTLHSIQPATVPSAASEERPAAFGPLYPPILLVENFPELVYDRNGNFAGATHLFIATGQRLWYVSNVTALGADSIQYWSMVSPTTISNLSSNQTYSNYYNNANSIPTAMAAGYPENGHYTVWIGTSNGRLLRIRYADKITINRADSMNYEDETPAIASLVNGRTISAIAVHPNNPNLVAIAVGSYAGPSQRIFVSTNATDTNPTFTSIHGNLPNVPVYSLFFHPDSSALLLAGTHWGLWRCININNPVWEEMTGEIIGRVPVTSITWKPYRYQVDTVDRSDPENPRWEIRLLPDPERPIFIGTWGRGIWKLNSRSATSLPTTTHNTSIRVEAFPNPFSDEIMMRMTLPTGAKRVSWQLLSLSGQRITTYTHSAPLSAGEHTIRWNISNLAQGIYFLQVEIIDSQGRRHIETRKLLHQ